MSYKTEIAYRCTNIQQIISLYDLAKSLGFRWSENCKWVLILDKIYRDLAISGKIYIFLTVDRYLMWSDKRIVYDNETKFFLKPPNEAKLKEDLCTLHLRGFF